MYPNRIGDIKILNARRFLELLRRKRVSSKSELARGIGVTAATISKLASELGDQGFVEDGEALASNGGRRPVNIRFKPDARYIVGLNLAGLTGWDLYLLDLDARVYGSRSIRSLPDDPSGSLKLAAEQLEQLLNETSIPAEKLLGVVTSIPGVFSFSRRQVVMSTGGVLDNVDLASRIEDVFGLRAVVANDANLAAMGAYHYFQGKYKNLAVMYLSRGIGLGLVLSGRLWVGSDGFAGEIGHLKMGDPSHRCICGEPGCLEATASMDQILRRYRELSGVPDRPGLPKPGRDDESFNEFVTAIGKNDDVAVEVADSAIKALGKAVSFVWDVLDPDLVVLAGELQPLDYFAAGVRKAAREFSYTSRWVDLRVVNVPSDSGLTILGMGELGFFEWVGRPSELTFSAEGGP